MTKYFLVVLLFTEGAQVGHPPERFEVGAPSPDPCQDQSCGGDGEQSGLAHLNLLSLRVDHCVCGSSQVRDFL